MPRTRSRLFKPKNSRFWYAVWTDHNGRPHRQSTGCGDHGAAAAWLASRELERVSAQAGIPFARPVPLALACAEYVNERAPLWSKGWHDAVDGFLANRVLPHFSPDRTVSTLTRADVERFRAQEIGRLKQNGAPVKDATVNRMLAALSAFGEWCLTQGRNYHTTNPWAKHSPLPEDEIPVPTIEDSALVAIMKALEDPVGPLPSHGRRKNRAPWRLIFEFVHETGLRKSDLGRLARTDIDLKTATMYATSTQKKGRTKGRRMHVLPLSERAVAILGQLPVRTDGLVFGRILDPRRAFHRAAKAAGLERVWLHLFRHLFASRIGERGAGRQELRDAGGWSSTRMVDKYLHARMERMRRLVEPGLEDLLK